MTRKSTAEAVRIAEPGSEITGSPFVIELWLAPGETWRQDTLNNLARAPQAASAAFGYVTPDGTARVVYRDVNSNITEIYLPPGQTWTQDGLSADVGAPQAASAPHAYVTPDGTARVIYQDVNSNITEIYLAPGQGWVQDGLNNVAGAPQAASAPFGYVTPDGTARVVYQDVNSNITEIYLPPGQTWTQDGLSADVGAPQAASAPHAYVTPDGTARVIYQDVNSNITEIYLAPGQGWVQDGLNNVAGAPQAASAPFGYVTPDGTARVVYQDVNSNITEIYLPPGQTWTQDGLSADVGAPQAASAPFGYVTPDGTARVVYQDVNSNITEIYLPPGQTWTQDGLNNVAGAPQAASAPAAYVTPDGTARVIYAGGSPAPAPASGLGSNSNYILYSDCNPLIDVSVTIEVTEDMVWQSASGPTDGFGFQLNAYSPQADLCAWQQYVLFLSGAELVGGIDNWPVTGNNLINDFFNLAPLPSVTLPAGYVLQISLGNDDNGNVVSATYVVTDNLGNTQANITQDLLSLGGVTSADLAPITAFELNVVGPINSESAVLSSGAGTITYAATSALTALSQEPPCTETGYITAETANSFYSALPAAPSTLFNQSFYVSTAAPMIRKEGKPRPGLIIPRA